MKPIPLFGVVNLPEMQEAAIAVLRSGRIASGEYVARFEAGIGELTSQQNVVATSDMTSALFLALHLSGVGPGYEVLTTAFACMSTNAAIAQTGATVVWVDLREDSIELDLEDLAVKISERTKAVVLYHAAGYPGPSREVAELCRARGIALIEDCNNATFSRRGGLPVGSHGDFAVHSFYPNRQITTTEGGALVCRDPAMAVRARKLRRFGIDMATFRAANGEINPASDIPEIGWSICMNNLCAAMGCAQLPSVLQRVARTRKMAEQLQQALAEIPGVQLLSLAADAEPVLWVLLLLVGNRDLVLQKMKDAGVMTSCVHQRNDLYSGFRSPVLDLPNTTILQEHVMAVPCGWWLDDDDVPTIAGALDAAVRASAGNRR